MKTGTFCSKALYCSMNIHCMSHLKCVAFQLLAQEILDLNLSLFSSAARNEAQYFKSMGQDILLINTATNKCT